MNQTIELQSETLKTHITGRIYTLRGTQVMLDNDLACLYGVETKHFNEAVKRNIRRFPSEFMFKLSNDEVKILKSQIATSSLAQALLRTR